ncbi:MAG: shikimate kinase [Micavibrio sp.]
MNGPVSDISPPVLKLSRPVTLTGLMGAGKTCLGEKLAERLGLPFVDADRVIEAEAGQSIQTLFQTQGEAAFRDLEERVIARLLSAERRVISLGGGAVMRPATEKIVREKSVSIWLDAPVEDLAARLAACGDRPLLKGGDPRAVLSALLEERRATYARAAIHINSGGNAPERVMDDMVAALRAYGNVQAGG